MKDFGVHSEVGKLHEVLVHQPDLSLKRLTPSNHLSFLFDDVLWVDRALDEHNGFVRLIRNEGVKVYYLQDLLTETLSAGEEVRRQMIDGVSAEMSVGVSALDAVRICLMDMEPAHLARHLIGGLTVSELECIYMKGMARFSLTAAVAGPDAFILPPLPKIHSLPAIHHPGSITGSPLTRCTGLPGKKKRSMQPWYTIITRCSGMQTSGSGSRCQKMKRGSGSWITPVPPWKVAM